MAKLVALNILWLKIEQEKMFKGTLFCHCLASSVSDPPWYNIIFQENSCFHSFHLLQYSHTSDILFPSDARKKKKNKRGEKTITHI